MKIPLVIHLVTLMVNVVILVVLSSFLTFCYVASSSDVHVVEFSLKDSIFANKALLTVMLFVLLMLFYSFIRVVKIFVGADNKNLTRQA